MRTTGSPFSEDSRRAYLKSDAKRVETVFSCINKGSMQSHLARNSLGDDYCSYQCLLTFGYTLDISTIS